MTTSAALAFFVCFLITIPNFHVCFCNGINSSSSSNHTHSNITCFQNERDALLKFKQDLKDASNRLSSWDIGEDCCKWAGVVCDNFTGHVREIRLQSPSFEGSFENDAEYEAYWRNKLTGKLNPSLLDLKHLQHLDLSLNSFDGAHIPSFIGSIATLRYLNLSMAGFGGTIPPQLGNVTTMRYLDLRSDNDGLLCGNLQWLSRLVLLQHLDMSRVNLSKAFDWLQVTSNLPSLVELHLSYCELEYVVSPSSTNKINFTSLDILDLSSNYHLGPSVPGWILSLNHLVSLDLRECLFEGPLPSGLQNMTSLRVLDWSLNNINSTIPNWLYSLSHLQSLNFHGNLLHGEVSIAIENLTSLVSLDLSDNQLQGSLPTSLGKLCKLKTIYLSVNQLQGSIPTSLGKLCKLKTIDLSDNQLQGSIPTSLGKLCQLKTIYLSYNEFSGEVADIFVGFSRCKSNELETFDSGGNHLLGHLPYELGQLTSLAYLDLDSNSFSGPIPASIGRLSSLIRLDLSNNKFNGTLPQSLGRLGKLEVLHINNNSLDGTLPESLGRLGKLESLSISDNLLEGVVSDVHFANLTKLRDLHAGGNRLTLNASENWVPPFQVESLFLDSWTLGPQFPLWLPSQMKLNYLSIANTRISDSIPTLFWPNLSKLYSADLSRNQIRGEISSILNVEGSPDLYWLDLSNNSFSGSMYHMLCDKGEEPNIALFYLNMGHNRLSGKIPDCWKHWQSLVIIKLENNNLEGSIPSSIGQLPYLKSLHLRHNNLTGELPQTLRNCSSLLIIDLGENKLTGTIPPWMGNASLGLIVLDLRSNNFLGNIPHELCRLSSLQILDVAYNNLFGHVPRCFANFSVMAKISNSSYNAYWTSSNTVQVFQDNAFLVTKGRDVEYRTTLGLVTSMDLSGNNLSGEIPEELTKLVGLWSLNLSSNHLTGRIPRNIGDMRKLESLDFSLNQLSGVIPPSMSSLTFLSHLNLSHNQLTGSIPSSTQLRSMNESSFDGNNLCGPPLTSCNPDKTLPPKVDRQANEEEEGEGFSEALFFASMALGFAVGFWIVLGPILFKRSWRITYFRVLEDIWHKLCDFIFECRYIFRR